MQENICYYALPMKKMHTQNVDIHSKPLPSLTVCRRDALPCN